MVSLGTANTVFSPKGYAISWYSSHSFCLLDVWTTCCYKWLLSPSWQGPSALYKSLSCHLYGSLLRNKPLISPCLSFSLSQGLCLGCSESIGTFWRFAHVSCWCLWCLPTSFRNFFPRSPFFLSLPSVCFVLVQMTSLRVWWPVPAFVMLRILF